MLCNFQPINSTGSMSVNACYEPVEEQVSLLPDKAPASRTLTFNAKAVVLALAIVGVVMIATTRVKQSAPQKSGALRSSSLAVVLEEAEDETHTLKEEHAVSVLLAGLKDLEGNKTEKRNWVEDRMQRVKSVATVRALHHYYHIIGRSELIGGPYADQAEGQEARKLIELGLHKYDGDDWKEYMNEEKATRKPPNGTQAGVGTTASLVAQVLPPDEKFVILILAWLPIDKYPWAGKGGVGAAHTHGQATCNFKFLNVVEGAGNTFYDVAGGSSTQTDMFNDGLPHKGGCKDHEYKPVLVTPRVGRDFIPSKDLVGATSGYIQDDHGAHSIDNMNSTKTQTVRDRSAVPGMARITVTPTARTRTRIFAPSHPRANIWMRQQIGRNITGTRTPSSGSTRSVNISQMHGCTSNAPSTTASMPNMSRTLSGIRPCSSDAGHPKCFRSTRFWPAVSSRLRLSWSGVTLAKYSC